MRYLVLLWAGLISILAHVVVILNLHSIRVQGYLPPASRLSVNLQVGQIVVEPAAGNEMLADRETARRQVESEPPSSFEIPKTSVAKTVYWPPDSLERKPMPVSAPDAHMLEGFFLPAEMIHLRLFIDERGVVRSVTVKAPAATAWAPVTRMFEATRFLPGQRAGQNVASWVEIEVNVSDLVRVL